tara:strand:- start:8 stop:562 length:555 start_codon:yes stop_codon:yes gene_type:complete
MPKDRKKEELFKEIQLAIQEVSDSKSALKKKSLSRYNQEKVAEILYLYSIGNSQTRIIEKYGHDRNGVVSILTDYADYFGKFKELSGQIAARNYMNMSSLEEDLIQAVRKRMKDGDLEPTFRDLKELSIAKANASREALTARGEATHISEDRKTYTQDDYDATIKAARERIKKAKVIDAEVQDA